MRPSRRARGLTLVEVLIALAIFVTIAALVGAGIVQALRVQSLNEASTSLQAKLRRISEVVSQDLRSAVFGGVTNSPFTSDSGAVSFNLVQGGQGFQVVEATAGGFVGASAVRVLSALNPGLEGGRALMVNGVGASTSFAVGSVSSIGGSLWNVVLSGCTNSIAYAQPVRAFAVESVGFSFDAATGTLNRGSVGGGSLPVAFGLTGFEIAYVYDGEDGSTLVRATPLMDGSSPARVADVGGVTYTMVALRVTMTAEAPVGGGGTVERSYVSQIPLPAGGNINLRSVVNCS